MKLYALRLKPQQELRKELEQFTRSKKIRAGFILTAVGSLDRATIRFAGAKTIKDLSGPFEIVSLVGTLSPDGPHLHIALGDRNGKTISGHLRAGVVRTTCELVIGESESHAFHRARDPKTGYDELVIKNK